MPFEFHRLDIPGLILVVPRRFEDSRGFFMETYKEADFQAAGIDAVFVQDNHSMSGLGVFRGIHFQYPPFAQGKLVRVVEGAAWDVAVDLRRSSPTFLRWVAVSLSGDNGHMIWIPPGFGHGFLALADRTHLTYKCTKEYSRNHDSGIRFDDPDLQIELPDPGGPIVMSEKDRQLPLLAETEVFP